MKRTFLVLFLATITVAAFAQKKPKFLSGNGDLLKQPASFLVEFDMSKTSLDGLESEEEFIEYKMKKAKDANKWAKAWKKDKMNFESYYTLALSKKFKKTGLNFNNDDPDSDYRMVVVPMHIQTGTPIKKSSLKLKLFFFDNKTGDEVAVLFLPEVYGEQMGPMTPTVGMRINVVLAYSVISFHKFYKKLLKE